MAAYNKNSWKEASQLHITNDDLSKVIRSTALFFFIGGESVSSFEVAQISFPEIEAFTCVDSERRKNFLPILFYSSNPHKTDNFSLVLG